MPATDLAIRELLDEINATLETLPSTRFVPYWMMRARAFERVLGTWSTQPVAPEQRDGLFEAVLGLRSEIARSSGQDVFVTRVRTVRNAS